MIIGTNNLFLDTINEWKQLSRKFNWNWYSFTLIHIEFENEKITGGAEFLFMLLGLGFRIRWNYNPDIIAEMRNETKEYLDSTVGLEEI